MLTQTPKVLLPRRRGKPMTHCKSGHEMTPENTRIMGGRARCRRCVNNSKLRSYYKDHEKSKQHLRDRYDPELYRAARLLRNYGLTVEQFEAKWADQQGRCDICRDHLVRGKFTHVDHDHITGEVRGLLCHRCNTGFGQLRESIEIFQAAIEYKRKYDQRGSSPEVFN